MQRPTLMLLVGSALAAAACGRDGGPKTSLAAAVSSDSIKRMEAAHALIGDKARAVLDTGNALFRKKAYDDALRHYRAASDLAPQHAAPIFGIYMVARAMNNTKLADSAMSEIRKRNGSLPEAPHTMSDSALKELHKKAGAKLPASGTG